MPVDDRQLRASDAEREEVADQLREHAVAGRLDASELEERLSLALAARTRGDLAAVLDDLPEPPLPTHEPGRLQRLLGGLARAPEPAQRYAALIVMFVALWAVMGGGYFWPVWPIVFLGFSFARKGYCHPGRPQRTAGSGSPRS